MSICVFWQQRNHYHFVPNGVGAFVVGRNFIIISSERGRRFPCGRQHYFILISLGQQVAPDRPDLLTPGFKGNKGPVVHNKYIQHIEYINCRCLDSAYQKTLLLHFIFFFPFSAFTAFPA